MKRLSIVVAAITVCLPAVTLAATPFTSNHPEEAYPDNAAPLTSGVFEDLLKQVQEKLRANGFDAGTANGTFNSKTQAALAQFQLSRNLPASGALDDKTLDELGVKQASRAGS
jgi:peptidoglycan hydrolase-like protein with peptidoglycan-binding domain